MSNARRLNPSWSLLGALTVVSGTVLVVWQSHLTFFFDDWDLLFDRPGISAHTLLEPHNEHIILAPALIYKLLQSGFGMESTTPYAVASIACFLASVLLLFIYLRGRVGDWLAVIAVTPILFMGSAYEDLLWPFQIGYFGSMAFGLGALLALARRSRRSDRVACGLLVCSLTFSEIGISFALAMALAIALDGDRRRRFYVVVVPLALYGLWYAGWGHHAQNSLSLHTVVNSPAFVLNGVAATLGSLLGLERSALFGGTGGLAWGRSVLLVLLVLLGWRLRRLGKPPPWFWVALALLLSFWLLTAFNAIAPRPPTAPRYQYVSAVFVLMVAAEAAAGWRPRTRVVIAAASIAVVATLGNALQLHQAYEGLHKSTPLVRGAFSGIEVAANTVSPGFKPTAQNSGFDFLGAVDAGPYLRSVHKYGSPAYSIDDLGSAPERGRIADDRVTAAALGLSLRPIRGLPAHPGPTPRVIGPPGGVVGREAGCVTVRRVGGVRPELGLPRRGVLLQAPHGVRATVRLRRFAQSFPIVPGTLHGAARLDTPPDRSDRHWKLQLGATGPVTACGL